MKTNYLSYLVAAVATIAMMSCSQQDELDNNQLPDTKLVVNTIIKNFVPDALSRVVDQVSPDGYETKFETGDRIGIYAIAANGTMMCKNLPMTYRDTEAWESESPIYFYKNATYIAYSPYNAALSNENIESVDDIKTYFINTVFPAATTYKACDLMTATATTDNQLPNQNTSSLTFNFAHAMSMVEFVVPVAKYITDAGFEYSEPTFDVQLTKKEGSGSEEAIVNIMPIGDGVYRSLLLPVASGETDKNLVFSGELLVGDGTRPVYFETQQPFTPLTGTFKRVNVTYSGAPTGIVNRNLEVGDYYYADGSIVPRDAAGIPDANRIGVIYKVGDGVTPLVGDKTNACVLAFNVEGTTRWGVNALVTQTGVLTTLATGLTAPSGYTERDTNCGNITTALNTYKGKYPAPDSSTGWYIPSISELITVVNSLQGSDAINFAADNQDISWNRNGVFVANIKRVLKLTEEHEIGWLWSVNESSSLNAWAINLGNAKIEVHSQRNKTTLSYTLRPVLAF